MYIIYIYTYICTNVYICTYTYIYTSNTYVYIYTCIYICIYLKSIYNKKERERTRASDRGGLGLHTKEKASIHVVQGGEDA